MRSVLVLTISGEDREGLVEQLAGVIAEYGGNWELCRMAHLAGRFVGLLEVTIGGDRQQDLEAALRTIPKLDIMIAAGSERDLNPEALRFFEMDLVGMDHPGIIRDVCSALAGADVNVESLETSTEVAADSGLTLFRASARLSGPLSVEREVISKELEAIAQDLMVEINFTE